MAVSIASLNIDIRANTAAFVKGIRSVESRVQAFGKSFNAFPGASTALNLLDQGFHKVAQSVTDAINRIDEAANVADSIGVTTDALMALRFAADQGGSSAAALDASLKKMSINLGNIAVGDGKKAAAAIQRLGLDAQAVAGMGTEKAFRNIALGISELPTPAAQAAAAVNIFGKAGMELLPFLQQGEAGLDEALAAFKRLGGGVGNGDKAIRGAKDSLDRLNVATENLAASLAVELAPSIERIADAAARTVASPGFKNLLEGVSRISEVAIATQLGGVADLTAKNQLARLGVKPGAAAKVDPAVQAATDAASAAFEALDSDAERFKKMAEDMRDPLAVFKEDMARANEALQSGLLSEEEFTLATRHLREEFAKVDPVLLEAARRIEETAAAQAELDRAYQDSVRERLADAKRESDQMAQRAKNIVDSLMTPLDEFKVAISEIKSLRDVGALTAEQFAQANEKLLSDAAADLTRDLISNIPETSHAGAVAAGTAEAFSAIMGGADRQRYERESIQIMRRMEEYLRRQAAEAKPQVAPGV